jgi:hypothetical protein
VFQAQEGSMATRAYWSGRIRLALVSIPVDIVRRENLVLSDTAGYSYVRLDSSRYVLSFRVDGPKLEYDSNENNFSYRHSKCIHFLLWK